MTNLINQSVATQGLSNWSAGWRNSGISTGTLNTTQTTFDASGEYFHIYANYGTAENRRYAMQNSQTLSVSAGNVYTLSFDVGPGSSTRFTGSNGALYVYLRWSDGTTYSSSWGSADANDVVTRTLSVTPPAGVTSATIEFQFEMQSYNHFYIKNVYLGQYTPDRSDTQTQPPPPPEPQPETPFDIKLEVEDTTSNASENLVLNPSGTESAFGWFANTSGPTVATTGSGDWTFLKFSASTQQATYFTNDFMEVNPGEYLGLRALWGGHSGDARIGVSLDWYSAAQAYISSTSIEVVDPLTAVDDEYNRVVQIPASVEYAKVRFTLYRYTGSNGNPWGGDFFEAREITVLTSTNINDIDDIQAWQAETSISWIDILADSHEIRVEREALNSGLMSAVVIKDAYDPAAGGFIAPGAAVRVQVKDGTLWKNIFQGTLNNVRTTYPRNAETRIAITANDGLALLANQKESRGIYDVDNLPLILADKGVKWEVNGVVAQVSSAPIASTNDSASVLDQIIISRDSDKAYAWIDADNVLQVWNRSALPTTAEVIYSDVANAGATYDSYSDIDVSFDTTACINVIEITYVRSDGTEVKYGPYIDADSLKKWGAYRSTFTLHGIAESEFNMQAFANEVFTKNANPTIKANSVVVPVKDARGRTHACTVDLYDVVKVIYSNRVNADYRVTGIRHEITPDKWLVHYTFEKGDSVAIPVWTPSVNGA